ncbi:MAG: M23 family metallopeptidase [Chloroflexota bacterium]|nr:MAG: M23 family metallopeptidase [Chloroflexota bacterium]
MKAATCKTIAAWLALLCGLALVVLAVLPASAAPIGPARVVVHTLRFPFVGRESPPTPTPAPIATPTPTSVATGAMACPGALFALPRIGLLGWTYGYPCLGDGGCASSGFHHGLDIASSPGSAVYAAYGGQVWFRSSVGVNIRHADLGLSTYYTHLGVINVRVGDTVTRGQVIGTLRDQGAGAFNHVHFSVLKDYGNDLIYADTRDPSDLLNANVSVASGARAHERDVGAWCRAGSPAPI